MPTPAARPRTVDDRVLSILHASVETDGNALRIVRQLERPEYVAVNRVLEAIGGAWNRKAKAHLFPIAAADALDPVLLTGTFAAPADYGFFETPPEVAQRVIEEADIKPNMSVLEPSAGTGNLASRALFKTAFVDCYEIQAGNALDLQARLKAFPAYQGIVYTADFLQQDPPDGVRDGFYHRVVMNPPFSRQQDIEHVQHARRFCARDGKIVSIMSGGVEFRTDRKATDFRNAVYDLGGSIERLPDGSFRESGTDVRTVIVTIPNAGIRR